MVVFTPTAPDARDSTMARFKAKAYLEGKETEVELDDEQFIAVEQHKARLNRTVQDRLAKQAVNIRKELSTNEDFVNDILTSKGIDPATLKPSGDPAKPSDSEVAKLQEQWRARELKPVQDELALVKSTLDGTRQAGLVSDLARALVGLGVPKAIAPRIAALEATRFGYDEKSGKYAVKQGESFKYAKTVTDEQPYQGVDEFAEEWVAAPDNAPFVQAPRQEGPGVGAAPKGGAGAPPAGTKRSAMTDAERVGFIEKHGFEAFTKLPA